MKPRLFVGSSSEGLAVANAVQSNLWRLAEVTVWTQGVFKPSSITLPAILDSLISQDFGLFVFTPDDVALVRGETQSVVRDNVIFELGLFMGRLGLERSFFLVPDGTDIRIASDLVGVTPLRYEVNRSDGNLAAAVAPACSEVEQEVRRLGFTSRLSPPTMGAILVASDSTIAAQTEQAQLAEIASTDSASAAIAEASSGEDEFDNTSWVAALLDDDMQAMRDRLTVQINSESDEKRRQTHEAWRAYAEYRLDNVNGKRALEDVEQKYPTDPDVYHIASFAYTWHGLPEEAIAVLERGATRVSRDRGSLVVARVRALRVLDRDDDALASLQDAVTASPVENAFTLLAEILESRKAFDEARFYLEQGVLRFPKSKEIVAKYATLLADHFDKKAALVQYNALVALAPDDVGPRVLRANLYLELNLNDLAMTEYKAANVLAKSEQGWILANIGNLYKNVGMFTDGIVYLEESLRKDAESAYGHERLGAALKLRDEQSAKLKEIETEGRKLLTKLRQQTAPERLAVSRGPQESKIAAP